MSLQPLGDKIVAKPIKPETKTASGILLPENATDKSDSAEVLAVGKEVKEVKVGDQIVHTGGYDIKAIKMEGEELILLREKEVLAVVKK